MTVPMSSLRRVCIVASATPLVVLSCVDLGGLANENGSDAGPDGAADADASETGPAEPKCPPGEKSCAGGCVPTNLPEYGCAAESCERCGLPFVENQICDNGKCSVGTCQVGRGDCDGKNDNGCESDLATAATCGSCKSACPVDNPLCGAGQCVKDCTAGAQQCGTQCVDLRTSATNCGGCGIPCPAANNATGTCVDSKCTLKCNNGFGDCDGVLANGCEALKPYYADGDGDGFGAGAKKGEACTAPAGSSLVLGDCLDTNEKVKPGQASFFFTGYTNAAGKLSYDYDCNGSEVTEPTRPVGDCNTCRVGDYVIVSRGAAPVNPNFYCGSTTMISGCSGSCSLTSTSGMGCR
jgi:hypothetical protein